VFISNTIYEGGRSFNRTSTASWLMFVRPPPILPPLPSPSPSRLALSHNQQPGYVPLPSFEGCGHNQQHLASLLRSENEAAVAPPLPKGCGRLILSSTEEIWGGGNTRGDPGSGRPIQCVPITNHDENRGSFSPFLAFSIPLTPSVPNASAAINDTDEDEARNDDNSSKGAHLYIPLSCINTRVIPKSLHTCIWDKPHHPKKQPYCHDAGDG
jgi:hypothetical protein